MGKAEENSGRGFEGAIGALRAITRQHTPVASLVFVIIEIFVTQKRAEFRRKGNVKARLIGEENGTPPEMIASAESYIADCRRALAEQPGIPVEIASDLTHEFHEGLRRGLAELGVQLG